MSKQNRVNPYGEICNSAAKGHLMGNRGILHNNQQEIVSSYKHKNWVVCILEFKGRKRSIMSPNTYTELFFWDEATAFSAGHRPCAECQRNRYNEFKKHWMAISGQDKVSAKEIDAKLHSERLAEKTDYLAIEELPDGVFIEMNNKPYLVNNHQLLEWTFNGYLKTNISTSQRLKLLTPPTILKIIQNGYKVSIIIS